MGVLVGVGLATAVLAWGPAIAAPVDALAAGDDRGSSWPQVLGEIPTDGQPVQAIETPPWGMVGAILQVAVILACPAVCLLVGALGLHERGEDGDAGVTDARERARDMHG